MKLEKQNKEHELVTVGNPKPPGRAFPEKNNYEMSTSCQIKNLNEIYLKYFGYKNEGSFVEAGAHDGYTWSNSFGLGSAGWRGILFEPTPHLANACAHNHTSFKTTTFPIALGAPETEGKMIDLYVDMVAGSLSTIKKEVAEAYNTMNWTNGHLKDMNTIKVPLHSLDNILQTSKFKDGSQFPKNFDVLCIDVEGAELDVIRGFNIDLWKPKMIIIETHESLPDERLKVDTPRIFDIFKFHGYNKIYSDEINSIWVSIPPLNED